MNNSFSLRILKEEYKLRLNITDYDRELFLLKLTKKLVICTTISLLIVLTFFFIFYQRAEVDRPCLTLIVFATGLIGGFVSIQQRIHKVNSNELRYLSQSWSSVLLIPIYGGIFALVLHIAFLSDIISGNLFPKYFLPEFGYPPQLSDFKSFFRATLPVTGQDAAKMLFWAFCAGFSERLVPQIIQNTSKQAKKATEDRMTRPVSRISEIRVHRNRR